MQHEHTKQHMLNSVPLISVLSAQWIVCFNRPGTGSTAAYDRSRSIAHCIEPLKTLLVVPQTRGTAGIIYNRSYQVDSMSMTVILF